MRKIWMSIVVGMLFTACTSANFQDGFAFLNTKAVPEAIQQVVATRVNAETELYSVGNASIGKTGSIIAQSKANKMASEALKVQIRRSVAEYYKTSIMSMDAYSKTLVTPAIPELTSYATDLIAKQVKQKGAWEDEDKVYSLLTVSNTEIIGTTQKVLRSFLGNTAKKLENLSQGI